LNNKNALRKNSAFAFPEIQTFNYHFANLLFSMKRKNTANAVFLVGLLIV